MAIDTKLILKLRNASQAGFADCKKALEENGNDLEKSIKWLRIKGIAKANNKNAFKSATEGSTWVKKNDFGAAIIEINSETDFTANSKEFTELSNQIIDAILAEKVGDIERIKKIKLNNGETVEENCLHLSSIVGEKIVLSKVKYFSLSSNKSASCYRHSNGKISTLIVLDKKLEDKDIMGLSVHYAANNPKFVFASEVDENWINSEKEIIVSLLKKENKPEQFHEKIVAERIKKLISQSTFVEQPYFYDSSKTVSEVLNFLGANIKEAVYFGLGDS